MQANCIGAYTAGNDFELMVADGIAIDAGGIRKNAFSGGRDTMSSLTRMTYNAVG